MMQENQAAPRLSSRRRLAGVLAAAAILLLYLFLRVRGLGHLLTYDEAMNLLSTRAFVAGGQDFFSYWFWRHPPLFNLLLELCRPFSSGYAVRGEVAAILSGAFGLVALFLLNRSVYGFRAALWSCAALAVMPGAVFFDTWLKRDVLLALPGLLGLLFYVRRRWLVAGIFLGAALLVKENAVFYALAIALVWLIERPGRFTRTLLPLGLVAALVCVWWYLFFSVSMLHFLAFTTGLPIADTESWRQPWTYYLDKINLDAGLAGLLLALAGALALWGPVRRKDESAPPPAGLWPIALLIPAILILQLSQGKTPWFLPVLFPALATLQGIGIEALLRTARRRPSAVLRGAAALLLFGVTLWSSAHLDYERFLERQDPGMYWGSSASRESALRLNTLAQPGARILITPMHYWPEENSLPCPIFTWYLHDFPVLLRPFDSTPDALLEDLRRYRIDWMMLSPPPGADAQQLIRPLVRRLGAKPIVLKGAVLMRVGRGKREEGKGSSG